mgnify:CR=1 FL=1
MSINVLLTLVEQYKEAAQRCGPLPEALPEIFCLQQCGHTSVRTQQQPEIKGALVNPLYRTHRLVDFRYSKSKHTSKYRRNLLWQALFRLF